MENTLTKSECFTCGDEISGGYWQVGHKEFCSTGCQKMEALAVRMDEIDEQRQELQARLDSLNDAKKQIIMERNTYKMRSND